MQKNKIKQSTIIKLMATANHNLNGIGWLTY